MRSFVRSLALSLVLAGGLCAQTDLFEWSLFASLNVSQRVVGLVFSPDGLKGAIATADGSIQIFDLDKRILSLRRIAQQAGRVVSLRFSSDGSALMSAGDDGIVLISSLTGGESRSIRTKGKLVSAAVSRDGKLLASSSADRSVSTWSVSSGTLLDQFQHKSKKPFFALGFFEKDSSLVGVSESGALYEWDVKTRGVLNHPQDEDDKITAASIGERCDLVAIGTEVAAFVKWFDQYGPIKSNNRLRENRIRIYNHGSVRKTLDGINGEIVALSFSPDAEFVSFIRQLEKDSFLMVYDVERGVEVASARLPVRGTAVAFSHDGQWLGAATERGDVMVRSIKGITNAVCPGDLRGVRWIITSSNTSPLLNAPHTVAVIAFGVNSVDQEGGLGSAVADMVRTRIGESQNVKVVERAQIEKVMNEKKIQVFGPFDPAKAVTLGHLLGASKLIFGSVSKFGTGSISKSDTRFTINVRMVDVETGAVDGEREITCKPCSASDLQEGVIRLKAVLVR